ncbi:hypothetical protein EDB92DRAFT_1829826 [Lactarius akahatsu]|uniref:Uncharacterized protein n=1 Tax=Lactarius akahatsu TaxID=416441 RepID=A0AAD4LQC7_9AGAM|nr:hypothetical protein EDB92DRAFT_1829826 [Lactarius akahatsu]
MLSCPVVRAWTRRSSTPEKKVARRLQISVMEGDFRFNGSWDILNSERMGAPGCVKEIEIVCPENRTSARLWDFCIFIRLIKFLRFGTSEMSSSKNVISMSPRRGAYILTTRPSKYSDIPRKSRRTIAGRTTRPLDDEVAPTKLAMGRMWSESARSWVIPDNASASASGESCKASKAS